MEHSNEDLFFVRKRESYEPSYCDSTNNSNTGVLMLSNTETSMAAFQIFIVKRKWIIGICDSSAFITDQESQIPKNNT